MLMIMLFTLQENNLTLLNQIFNLASRFCKNGKDIILNPGKSRYMLLGGYHQINYLNMNNTEIEISGNERLLGVILDNDLKFDAHIKSLCRNAVGKLSALSQIIKYFTDDQKHPLVNFGVKSQSNYCHLIQMFSSTTLTYLLNHIQELEVRLFYE